MVAFVVNSFQGLAPRFADRLLDDAQASHVANLKATNGNLRGFRSLDQVATFTPAGHVYRRAIKFYYPGSDDFEWFLSDDINADAVANPLANDAYNRIYFTEASQANLRVTTLALLDTGGPSVAAGVPRPTLAPTVAPPSGGGGFPRAYVYTYQTAFGSEGPPSPPTVQDSSTSGGTWNITIPAAPPAGVTKINIYHSASGEESSGSYYKVGEITPPTLTFADSMALNLVPLQPPLTSFDNDPAPDGIQGLVVHSSGALAAFKGRTVYFSVPYLPHAWPQSWPITVESEVVGLAAILNYIVVMTKGHPFIIAGTHPSTMAPIRLPDPEPCTSKRSIVVMNNAAYFTSPNGLCAISQTGLSRPTNPLMTRDEFSDYSPETIFAGIYGSFYVAFYEDSRGFVVSLPPYEPTQFVPLDRYSGVTGLDSDGRTGDLTVLRGDAAYLFDKVHDSRFSTTFRSREFIATYPINLGAIQILFKSVRNEDDLDRLLDAIEDYNEERFDLGPLDMLDAYPIDGEIDFPDIADMDPILSGLPPIQPLGGEPLYSTNDFGGLDNINAVLIADGVVRYSKVIVDEKVHKMPAGYKATRFYVEVSGGMEIERLVVAETGKECRNA